MQVSGCVAVVTGAGRGIGRALCRELARRGAGAVVAADLDGEAAAATGAGLGGFGVACDVASEAAVRALAAETERRCGRVDLWISNAGFGGPALDLDDATSAPNELWQRMWDVHVMAHVYAARAVLPGMQARGRGHLVNVASAAGLLSQVGDAPYSATKHAAVAFAESLAIAHGDRGISVSVVCPQYVATRIIHLDEDAPPPVEGVLAVHQAATAIVDGIERDDFLILTHPEVLGYFQRKAADYPRWLAGMRRVRETWRRGAFLGGRS